MLRRFGVVLLELMVAGLVFIGLLLVLSLFDITNKLALSICAALAYFPLNSLIMAFCLNVLFEVVYTLVRRKNQKPSKTSPK
jgi:hypothetical protein